MEFTTAPLAKILATSLNELLATSEDSATGYISGTTYFSVTRVIKQVLS